MTHKPLDFATIEKLRAHMKIQTQDWVKILRVSRMTYYKWVNDLSQPRARKSQMVRERIKKLLAVMAQGWPSPEDQGLEPEQRTQRLLALLGE